MRKKKAKIRIKVRKKWVINPKVRIKVSGKVYSRKHGKGDIIKELNKEGI